MLLLGWGCHKLFCGDATSEQTRVAVFHQVGGGEKVVRWLVPWQGCWWQGQGGGKVVRWQIDKASRWQGGWCRDKVADNRLEKHLQKDTAAVL